MIPFSYLKQGEACSPVEWSDDSHPDYQVKVRAVNAAGASEPSILAFKTRVRAPTHLRFSQRNVDLLPGTHSFEVWAMDRAGSLANWAPSGLLRNAMSGHCRPSRTVRVRVTFHPFPGSAPRI